MGGTRSCCIVAEVSELSENDLEVEEEGLEWESRWRVWLLPGWMQPCDVVYPSNALLAVVGVVMGQKGSRIGKKVKGVDN